MSPQLPRRAAIPALGLAVLAASAASACSVGRPIDLAREKAELLAMHRQILDAHKTDDLDAWLALEADEIIVGSRGEIRSSRKAERTEQRREYLAQTDFSVYRDLREPIVQVSADGSLGWLYAQVEIAGTRTGPEGTAPIHDQWAWVELYERRPEGWRLAGNVSTPKPEPGE